ncbi:DUF6297 family protein [Actinomyces procaprae]|uniref:DUF6297 family protein n=1 Tax=Actinomyces procaprae TaxID=2560010 RepID=UPI0014460657|nr:DUF6297 family protein [Actinomyces procaprae]
MSPADHHARKLPAGRELRRWVRAHTARTRSPWALLGDIYDAVLAAAILAALAAPYLGRLGTGTTPTRGTGGMDPTWAVLVLLLLLAGMLVEPLRRLGPLFLRTYEAAWWLNMPGDRRGLLEPVAWAEAAVAVAAGGGAGLLLAVMAGAGAITATGMVLLAGACGALLLVALVRAQVVDAGLPAVRRTLLGAAVIALSAGALGAPSPSRVPGGLFVSLGLGTGLAAAVWWWRLRVRLVEIPDAHLLEVAARNLGVQVSLLSLDTRALGRLLSAPVRRPAASSRLPLARLALRLLPGLRPLLGVAQADCLLLWRQPRRALQLLAGGIVAVFPLFSSGVGAVGAVVFHLVGGWLAVLALAEPARRAWFDGGADASWPTGPVRVRCGHLLVPTAIMIAWTAAVVVAQLFASGQLPESAGQAWAAAGLVVAAGCGWAGAALRSGFRPTPDFSLGLVASPVGSLPPGTVEMLVSGPDAAAIAGLPTALLALGVPVTARLLGVQLVASGAVVTWGLLTGRRA